MALVKICPSCEYVNSYDEVMCRQCMADITVIPVIDTEAQAASQNLTPAAEPVRTFLVLECLNDGENLTLKDDSVLGRESEGSKPLGKFETVSRQHARFICGEKWTVEDLNSTNGTWINGRRIAQGEKYSLKSGDVIALSKSCAFTVKYIDEV